MTAAELLDTLDAASVAYQVRDGMLVWRAGHGLDAATVAEMQAQRAELAAEATRHYADRGMEPWHCHACTGLVRAGTGRIVHPPDWPAAKRGSAPVMHTWCFGAQPWWQADVDDPLATYADVIEAARSGQVPEEGSVPLDRCTTICNPQASVLTNAALVAAADCWLRTSAVCLDALARLAAVAAWWRVQEQRKAA